MHLKITSSDRLEIHAEHPVSYDTYQASLRYEDVKKENQRLNAMIETPALLYQCVDLAVKERPFEEVVRVDDKGRVHFHLEFTLDFKFGSKKKAVVFEFPTKHSRSTVSESERMRRELAREKHERTEEMEKQGRAISQLQDENRQIKAALEKILSAEGSRGTASEPTAQIVSAALRSSPSLMAINNCIVQTACRFDVALIGPIIHPSTLPRMQRQW